MTYALGAVDISVPICFMAPNVLTVAQMSMMTARPARTRDGQMRRATRPMKVLWQLLSMLYAQKASARVARSRYAVSARMRPIAERIAARRNMTNAAVC